MTNNYYQRRHKVRPAVSPSNTCFTGTSFFTNGLPPIIRNAMLLIFFMFGGFFLTHPAEVSAQITTEPLVISAQHEEKPDDNDEIIRRRVIGLQYELLELLVNNLNKDLVVSFELFDDMTIHVRPVRVDRWSASEYTLHGEYVERQGSINMEINTHERIVYSSFQVDGRNFRIKHLENEWYEVQELDLSRLQEHPPDWQKPFEEEPSGDFKSSDRDTSNLVTSFTMRPPDYYLEDDKKKSATTMSADDDILDVLMLYFDDAAVQAGGIANMVLNIRNAFSNANTSFQNSGVNARVRSAGIRQVTWEGSSDANMDNYVNVLKNAINDSDHIIHQWREEFGADIVGLVYTLNDDWCGRVYEVMGNVTENFRDKAVFVVKEGNCLGGNYSFVHEIGHLLGARHDWYVDNTDGKPFAYNHGYVHIDGGTSGTIGWRTIMAYNTECADENPSLENGPFCTRLNFWSNPNNTHNGDPMGVASGSNAADNVRALNNTIPTAVNFMDEAPVVFGTVTDLLTGNGMEDVPMAGVYGPITDNNGFYSAVVRRGKSFWLTPEVPANIPLALEYVFDPSVPLQLPNVTTNRLRNFNAGVYRSITGRIIPFDNLDPSGVRLEGAPGGTTPLTDQFGRYNFDVLANWQGTITPSRDNGLTFDPPSRQYSNLTSDQVDQNYEMRLRFYRITGDITEVGTTFGVDNVNLEGLPWPFPPYVTTNINGGYTYNLQHGWSGTVRPFRMGYRFEPRFRTYQNINDDISDDYTAIATAVADSQWPIFGSDGANTGRIIGSRVNSEILWSTDVQGFDQVAGGIATAPVIDDRGWIAVAANDGTITVLDEDGDEMWRQSMGKGVEVIAPLLAGSGRMFYVVTVGENSSRLYQLEDEGGVRAFFDVNDSIHTTPAVTRQDTIYIGADDGRLYALRTSRFLLEEWSFEAGDKIRSSPAATPGGTVYFGSDDGLFYAVNPDGSLKWTFEAGDKIRSAPTLDTDQGNNGQVYFGSDNGIFYALDMETGDVKWQLVTGDAIRSSAAIGSNGNVYFGSNDNRVYAVSATGSPLGSFNANAPVTASPAISTSESGQDVLYVGADGGRMYAFNIKESTQSTFPFSPLLNMRWMVTPPGPAAAISSAALKDGVLYFTHGNMLVALGGEGEDDDDDKDSSSTQFVFTGFDPRFDLFRERVHIIIWLSEIGGPLGLGEPFNPEDPCPSGPLFIPQCSNNGGRFGQSTPFVNVIPDKDLLIGVAVGPPSLIEDIALGRTTEGLLGTTRARLARGSRSTIVIGGVTDPDAFIANPDRRSIQLGAFIKNHGLDKPPDKEGVSVYTGHLSTDAPSLEMRLEGMDRSFSFGRLGYGDFSSTLTVPRGKYNLTMIPDNRFNRSVTADVIQYEVEITGEDDELVGLLATGFMDPEKNQDGPALNYTGVSSTGDETEPTYADETAEDIPQDVVLEQNYPNPFNPSTRIRYALPEHSHVRLSVFNILGQQVATLVDENRDAGFHEVVFDAAGLSSGVYIYRIETDGFSDSRQMLLMK